MIEVRNILDFSDYIDLLLLREESDDLEFKSASGGFPGSFWDTYSAFANSEGGVIVLGVVEKKGKFYIDSLSDEQIEKYTKDFWNNVNNRARGTKEEGFTMAGVLMFGKEDSILDTDCCPNFFPDYQEKLSDDPEIRWTNRICPDGTWEANLFQFYLRVLPRLCAVLPKPFILKDNIRRDETPAHVAVREALVNLCIHTDYSEDATMVVRLYPNKMVFYSPGTLLVSKTQYYEESTSVCRNKTLQKMFMLIGSAEKAGSGVDKILAGWRFANWRTPMLRLLTQPDIVELTMMMESLVDNTTMERLALVFGPEITSVGQMRLLALNAACVDGYVTNESLRVVLDIHKGEIADLLKDMCKEGLLVKAGYGRGTRYYLPKVDSKVASSGAKVASSDSNITSNIASSISKVASSGSKVASLGSNIPSNIASSASNITSSDSKVASSDIKLRMTYTKLKEEICTFCSDWVSIDELADGIHRKRTYLRNKIIPKMLADNSLEMLFPGVPKHPRQKYKSIVNKK